MLPLGGRMHIKLVSKEEVYPLRHQVLRPQKPFDEIIYDTDTEIETFHVGAYLEDKLICVASFNRADLVHGYASQDTQKTQAHFRLRAMATLPEYRRLGAGRAVVSFAENYLLKEGIHLIWCRGRTSVQGYYEALGFVALGDVYDYPTLGEHITLYKNLDKQL